MELRWRIRQALLVVTAGLALLSFLRVIATQPIPGVFAAPPLQASPTPYPLGQTVTLSDKTMALLSSARRTIGTNTEIVQIAVVVTSLSNDAQIGDFEAIDDSNNTLAPVTAQGTPKPTGKLLAGTRNPFNIAFRVTGPVASMRVNYRDKGGSGTPDAVFTIDRFDGVAVPETSPVAAGTSTPALVTATPSSPTAVPATPTPAATSTPVLTPTATITPLPTATVAPPTNTPPPTPTNTPAPPPTPTVSLPATGDGTLRGEIEDRFGSLGATLALAFVSLASAAGAVALSFHQRR